MSTRAAPITAAGRTVRIVACKAAEDQPLDDMRDGAPPLIDNSRVVQFADVRAVAFSGNDPVYVDSSPVGCVPHLAICEDLKTGEILLHRCDSEWVSLAVSVHSSVADARARAEQAYPGSEPRWLHSRLTRDDAISVRRESWGEFTCSSCGRTPDHFETLVTDRHGEHVCNECLERNGL